MFAQVISFEETADEVVAGIKHVEEEILPALKDADGVTGFWLVDRDSGKRLSVMVWDSEEAAAAGMAAIEARRAELGKADAPRPTPSSVDRMEVYGSV